MKGLWSLNLIFKGPNQPPRMLLSILKWLWEYQNSISCEWNHTFIHLATMVKKPQKVAKKLISQKSYSNWGEIKLNMNKKCVKSLKNLFSIFNTNLICSCFCVSNIIDKYSISANPLSGNRYVFKEKKVGLNRRSCRFFFFSAQKYSHWKKLWIDAAYGACTLGNIVGHL